MASSIASKRPNAPQDLPPLALHDEGALLGRPDSISGGEAGTGAGSGAGAGQSFLSALVSPSQIDTSDIMNHGAGSSSGAAQASTSPYMGAAGAGLGLFGPFHSADTSPKTISSARPSIPHRSYSSQYSQAAGASSPSWAPGANGASTSSSGNGGSSSSGSASRRPGSAGTPSAVPGVDASLSRSSDASLIAPFDEPFGAPDLPFARQAHQHHSHHASSSSGSGSAGVSGYLPKRHGSSGDLLTHPAAHHTRSNTSPAVDYRALPSTGQSYGQGRPRTPSRSSSAAPGTPNGGGNVGANSGTALHIQFAHPYSLQSSSPALAGSTGQPPLPHPPPIPSSSQAAALGSLNNPSMNSLLQQPPTPSSNGKKHKMGFGFFKKKSSKDIKDAGYDGKVSSSGASFRSVSDRQQSPGTPATTHSHSLHHAPSSMSLHSSKASIGGGRGDATGHAASNAGSVRGRGKLENLGIGTAVGLDEEALRAPTGAGANGSLGPAFGGSPNIAAGGSGGVGSSGASVKKLKLRRPRTADRDKSSGGLDVEHDGMPLTPNMLALSRQQQGWNGDADRGGLTPSQEIAGFSLDTNFDRIDDFVDISVRQRDPNADGLLGASAARPSVSTTTSSSHSSGGAGASSSNLLPSGSAASPASPTSSHHPSLHQPSISGSSVSSAHAHGRARSGSNGLSMVGSSGPGARILRHGSAEAVPTLRATMRTASSSGVPQAIGEADSSFDASSSIGSAAGRGTVAASVSTAQDTPTAETPPPAAIDITSRPGLRRMTKSQYRAMLKNGERSGSAGEGAVRGAAGAVSDEPMEVATALEERRDSLQARVPHVAGGPRKDSAASGRSDHSGVSPKSSYIQLPQMSPSLVQAGQWTAGDAPNFSFPEASGVVEPSRARPSQSSVATSITSIEAQKRAQQLKASNWMAPDSWAVQPDKSRAFSMEEEQDSDDDEVVETTTEVTMRRDSSSGMTGSSITADRAARNWSSGDAGAGSSNSRILDGQRRPTQDSASLHSTDDSTTNSQLRQAANQAGGMPAPMRRPSDIEVVQGPTWALPNGQTPAWSLQNSAYAHVDYHVPAASQQVRPHSGRSGTSALAAASGAAASAASKLGLRGPGGRHAKAQRPGTAGSIQGSAMQEPGVAGRATGGSLGGASMDDEQVSPNASMSGILSKDSGSRIRRPGTATGITAASKPHLIRIWRKDGSFMTLSCALISTTNDIKSLLTRKSLSTDNAAYRLFVRDKGNERPLGPAEKPALIQRRRLEQAGYTDADGLEDMGREDLSYLLRFVYRPDIVPTFDSESFGNEEHMFQHLDLQGRNLEMVPIFLYKHADWIVSLDLSGNPMSDIPSDFMQMCSNLRSLRLSNLALKRLPQGVRQSETLTHLDVSNNRIPELAHISLESCQEILSIKAQNNRLFDLPPWFARIETLRYLNLSNNRFEVFPPVLCDASGLVDLDISFNSISTLPSCISKLTNLQRFIFVGNSVEQLPQAMSSLVKLQTVDLRRNLVQDVSVLFTMPQVNVVQCEHNSIRHFEATLGTKMRTLEVGQNPLTKVSIGAYSASDLTSLNLSYANMAKLEESLFKLLPSLQELNLDRNQFVTLPDSLGELVSLVSFSCTNNNLATLPDSIGSLKKLVRVTIQNNNLKSLPNSIWSCASLQRLNVTSNLLESFPAPPLLSSDDSGRKGSTGSHTQAPPTPIARQLPPLARSLRKLRLGDNRVGDDVFSVLTVFLDLEVLNLSFNEIYEVPSTSLACNKRLRELYLSGNSLTSLPADDFVHMQELRTLHLNGNKLQTLPAELGRMRKLASLDVGNNNLKYNIANWTYDWNWNSNPELRYLNLSGNKRLEIKSKIVEVNGRRKNMSDFSRLLSMRVLGLMDVTMTLQSTPDETDNRRVRTSLSQINNMAYGIADTLGKHDNLSIVDVVVPNFRKDESECLFGLFDGRGHDPSAGSRIARHLAEWVSFRIERELQEVERSGPEAGSVPDTLRRAFLRMNKEYADTLIIEGQRRTSETQAMDDKQPLSLHRASFGPRSQWKAGASALIAYMADRTLYIANSGDALAVMSRNGGQAELISTKHEPFDRAETERIRSAEGWVSLRGFVNDTLDVSRGFGYYHLFPVVNAAPAVTTIHLSDSDEFVIVANKVLWDFLSYQTAVDIARMERDDPMIAAQRLRDLAISSGAEDSIVVMIISVSDIFYARQQQSGGAAVDPSLDVFKRLQRRAREPRDLPADRTLARLEREVAPPIGQVALVFTDIKNSTSLWENNGGMQSAMRLHNTLLRRQLRTVGGYEVKTEGDAFMVSFPSVSAALLWCFNVQMQLLREDWPQEILESEDGKEVRDSNGEIIYRGLWVRMGLHWGFPVCEPDPVTRRMDYFGPMVNRASRISGAADGGQILVSKDVINELTTLLGTFGEAQEIEGNVDDDEFRMLNPNVSRDVVLLRRMGFGISDMGERRLKGLETPEALFLVYPKQLSGRLEGDGRAIAPTAQVFEPTLQLLDIDEVKQVGLLCLRLEALSAGHVFPGLYAGGEMVKTPQEKDAKAAVDRNSGSFANALAATSGHPNAFARRKAVEAALTVHPELLIYVVRDDAPDEELAGILEQLVTRIANAVAKLQLDQMALMLDLGLDLNSLRARLQAIQARA